MSEDVKVKVIFDGMVKTARSGDVLSEVIGSEKPCGGHGVCGKCKVRVKGAVSEITETEKRLLTGAEVDSGIRLSCLTRVLGDCSAERDQRSESAEILTRAVGKTYKTNPAFTGLGVAVDIGTTTLAARLYNTHGVLLTEAAKLNPQSTVGQDVVSRIEYALGGGAERLCRLATLAVTELIEELCIKADMAVSAVDYIVITGNTAMLSLLTGESVRPLSAAPFEVKRLFGEQLTARDIGIDCVPFDTKVYIPSCISAFVGADTVCAILFSGMLDESEALLADIGTNGEMALWREGRLTVCSTAAGPAFEGVGISCGMRGGIGAIDSVTVKDGKLLPHTVGNITPVGICGSGIVDLAACMLDVGPLDEDGYLDENVILSDSVTVDQGDIRQLQLAKSAISSGILTLLENEKCKKNFFGSFYIAGGFGNYLNTDNAVKIGLLPERCVRNATVIGNAALGGASMLLLDRELVGKDNEIARCAELLELSGNPVFSELFIMGMPFEKIQ